MKQSFTNRILIASAILCLVALQIGCKENTLINSKISPSGNQVNVKSYSLGCITHTYYDDTAITSTNIGGIPCYQGVGSYYDPYFGTMTGATFFQVVPVDYTDAIYTNSTIDSVLLILPYSGFTYGIISDSVLPQTYQVFYMDDTLGGLSTYYSYSTKPINTADPLSAPTTVNLTAMRDSFYTNTQHSGLRIHLNKDAFLRHLNPALKVVDGSSSPTTDFLNSFNGICVRMADTRQSSGVMPYFRLDGSDPLSQAGILVYYHTNGSTTVDSENYYFSQSACAHFNNITKSYSHFPVNKLLTSTAANDEVIVLQNQPGPNIDVIIPHIDSIPAGIINKAELQLTLIDTNTTLWPEKLYPVGIGSATYPVGVGYNRKYNVADQYPLTSLTPETVMDGYVHTITRNGHAASVFTIDIPRELMAAIAAKSNTIHLHINGTQDFYGAFQMTVGGGGNSADSLRPRLFVVYSSLNQ